MDLCVVENSQQLCLIPLLPPKVVLDRDRIRHDPPQKLISPLLLLLLPVVGHTVGSQRSAQLHELAGEGAGLVVADCCTVEAEGKKEGHADLNPGKTVVKRCQALLLCKALGWEEVEQRWDLDQRRQCDGEGSGGHPGSMSRVGGKERRKRGKLGVWRENV